MIRPLFAAVGCVLLFGCGRGQPNEQATSKPPDAAVIIDGTWTGKTSQDRLIELVVKDGALMSLKLGMSLKLDAVCARPGSPVAVDYRGGETATTFNTPIRVTSNKFIAAAGVSDVDARVQGEFAPSGLTGTIELQATPASRCSGKDHVTWSAVRSPVSK